MKKLGLILDVLLPILTAVFMVGLFCMVWGDFIFWLRFSATSVLSISVVRFFSDVVDRYNMDMQRNSMIELSKKLRSLMSDLTDTGSTDIPLRNKEEILTSKDFKTKTRQAATTYADKIKPTVLNEFLEGMSPIERHKYEKKKSTTKTKKK
jgi:hypothetical protein